MISLRPYINTFGATKGQEERFANASGAMAEGLESVAKPKASCIDFFFAKPYYFRECGANENTNGLIRGYIPNTANFQFVDQQRCSGN